MTNINIDAISGRIRANARQYIVPRFGALAAGDITVKDNAEDFVTIADIEMEKAVTADLTSLYPDAKVLGEEAVYADPSSMKLLDDKDSVVFICDPVDGTMNFKSANPTFGVLLACLTRGELTHAWIYDVMKDRMVTAEKGGGTWQDGKKIEVKGHEIPAEASGYTHPGFFPEPMQDFVKKLSESFLETSTLRCSAHEYLGLLDGKADFILGGDIMPWDHLPGTLALREAGGLSTDWRGAAYAPKGRERGIIAATSAPLAQYLSERVSAETERVYGKCAQLTPS